MLFIKAKKTKLQKVNRNPYTQDSPRGIQGLADKTNLVRRATLFSYFHKSLLISSLREKLELSYHLHNLKSIALFKFKYKKNVKIQPHTEIQ